MKFTYDDSGLRKLSKNLEKMNDEISFSELFSSDFMQRYSKFLSFDELLENSEFIVNTQEDFEAIPDKDFDEYISKVTSFDNWKDMMEKSVTYYMKKTLGL